MPNHVSQKVTIVGNKFLIDHLHKELKADRFCQVVIPRPLVYNQDQDWYSWNCNNWGTKWGVYEISDIECDVSSESIFFRRDVSGEGKLTFRCLSAWSPPTPVWDELVNLGFSVEAVFLDECYNYWGYYLDGEEQTESKEQGPIWDLASKVFNAVWYEEGEEAEEGVAA